MGPPPNTHSLERNNFDKYNLIPRVGGVLFANNPRRNPRGLYSGALRYINTHTHTHTHENSFVLLYSRIKKMPRTVTLCILTLHYVQKFPVGTILFCVCRRRNPDCVISFERDSIC